MKETTENDSSKNSLCFLPFSINVGILRHADYNAAMAQERYSKISEAMVEGKPYSKIELLRLIQNCYPDLSSHSEAWVIYHLLKQGSCCKIGHGLYLKNSALVSYQNPPLPSSIQSLIEQLKRRFPQTPVVAFESSCLNEWLNELIASSTPVIEVESSLLEDAYYALSAKSSYRILLKPTDKEMTHYRQGQFLILEPLTSRAPLNKEGTGIRLEKLMVDLLADSFFSYFFSLGECPNIFQEITQRYIVDSGTLFTYAKRRHVEAELKALLPQMNPARGNGND
jgi:hypothetical protein